MILEIITHLELNLMGYIVIRLIAVYSLLGIILYIILWLLVGYLLHNETTFLETTANEVDLEPLILQKRRLGNSFIRPQLYHLEISKMCYSSFPDLAALSHQDI